MKKIAIEFLTKMLPIMIGVYLGFALNNFGESRKVKKQAETYQKMLQNEITENLTEIKKVKEYHIQLSKDISGLLKSDDLEKAFSEYSLNGVQPGFVNRSAYDTGIQTGVIQEFDLKLIQDLNRLYNLQRRYNTFNEDMIRSFISQKYPETASEIKSILTIMSMNMNDVKNFEYELTNFYGGMLEQLKSYNK